MNKLTRHLWTLQAAWLWNGIAILFFVIAISLATDISARFLIGGPDVIGAFAALSQGALALLVAGGALTKAGGEAIERALATLRISSQFRPATTLGLAMTLFVLLLVFRLMLPGIAVLYNNSGFDHHTEGRLLTAQLNYNRALSLDPDYTQAHYNLGLLHEDLLDFGAARREYRLAVLGGLDLAYNNLARLHILDGEPSKAISLLEDGLAIVMDDDTRYSMLKNRGWARQLQSRYPDAKAALNQAVGLDSEKAAGHCLLAQVLDAQMDEAAARKEWLLCLALASSKVVEEDEWIGTARERLKADGEAQP